MTPTRLACLACLACLALALAGCSDDPPNGGTTDAAADADATTDPAADVAFDSADADVEFDSADADVVEDVDPDAPWDADLQLTFVTSPTNVLAGYLDWATSHPANSSVQIQCGEEEWSVDDLSGERTSHSAYLQTFWQGAECTATVISESPEGESATGSLELVFDQEFPEVLPEFEFSAHDPARMAPGWTLFNLSDQVEWEAPLRIVVLDEQNRYRWYNIPPGGDPGGATEVRLLSDGLLVSGRSRQANGFVMNWDGAQVWEAEFPHHHDLRPWNDDENLVVTLWWDEDCPELRDHSVEIWDRAAQERVWQFGLCDTYLPTPPYEDWSHLNTTEPWPDWSAVLISSRHQNSLFKINVETSEIEWMLGHPSNGWEPSEVPRLQLDVADRFWRQHAPEYHADDNTILLFDNGSGARQSSRFAEYRIDEDALTAELVWEWSPDPVIYAPQWGDADRLVNNNVLGVFGEKSATEPSHIIEVTRGGEEVWHLSAAPPNGIYRADRVEIADIPRGWIE